MQEGKVNYFVGNNPEKWKTNISTYNAVVYKEIYPDIDMKFYGNNSQMEYDIVVKPEADPSIVKLAYEGIEGLKVTEEGELEIALKEGKLIQKKPYIYQEIDGKRVEIEGKFKVKSEELRVQNDNSQHVYSFDVASYDKAHSLIIDPTLVYFTYLGGSTADVGRDIAVDDLGNAYVTGFTWSTDYPTASPIQGSNVGGADVFVSKINSAGTALVYSTYLGGSGSDNGYAIAVDSSGNACVTGNAVSTDFPTALPIQGSNAGSNEAFVAKISTTPAELPKTGQRTSYSTGDDGDLEWGVAWPSPRFTDNLDSTVTDNLTGLMWLKDANCIATQYPSYDNDGTTGDGEVTWQHSLDFVAGINAGTYSNCGASYTDWHLPNINELKSLVNAEESSSSTWLTGQGFSNVQYHIWSSTTYAFDTSKAFDVSMGDRGDLYPYDKTFNFYVWSVRTGQGGKVQIPRTGQTTSYYTGDDGDLEMGVAWPSPRFSDNLDSTVTDNLTGLIWTKDANLPGTAKTWQESLDYVAGMNAGTYSNFGYIDWRFPNRMELHSLNRPFPIQPSFTIRPSFHKCTVAILRLFYWYQE